MEIASTAVVFRKKGTKKASNTDSEANSKILCRTWTAKLGKKGNDERGEINNYQRRKLKHDGREENKKPYMREERC